VKRRNLKLAQDATLNKAIGAVMRLCGIKGKWRKGVEGVRPLVVTGDGNFTSEPGRPIRHFQFFMRLKSELEALSSDSVNSTASTRKSDTFRESWGSSKSTSEEVKPEASNQSLHSRPASKQLTRPPSVFSQASN
ncbi:hypothetical protein BGZ91_006653, partial [Linnemannia elongata]